LLPDISSTFEVLGFESCLNNSVSTDKRSSIGEPKTDNFLSTDFFFGLFFNPEDGGEKLPGKEGGFQELHGLYAPEDETL
jgi:hypothetical protein